MSPEVIGTMRLTIRMAVVLPHPDGPTRTQMSPAGTSSESDRMAGSSLPGYVFETCRNSSAAAIRQLYPTPSTGSDPLEGDRGLNPRRGQTPLRVVEGLCGGVRLRPRRGLPGRPRSRGSRPAAPGG